MGDIAAHTTLFALMVVAAPAACAGGGDNSGHRAASRLQHLPCVRTEDHLLHCPSSSSLFPSINLTEPLVPGKKFSKNTTCKRERIDEFIDENKSMIRRMLGHDHETVDVSSLSYYKTFDGRRIYHDSGGDNTNTQRASPPHDKHSRERRAIYSNTGKTSENKVDACESTVEVVTPYWASNSQGKIRAIVNTQHLQQAIQQEVCQSAQTRKCNTDCGCEQKYKWHRLLAYDPDDDCKGVFMDWFLFPSCCVCRCQQVASSVPVGSRRH